MPETCVALDEVTVRSRRFKSLWLCARTQNLVAVLLVLPLPLLLAGYLLSGGLIGAFSENESRDHVMLVTIMLLKFLPIVLATTAVIPGFYGRSILLYAIAAFTLCGAGAAGFIYAAIGMRRLFGPEDGYGYWYVAIAGLTLILGTALYGGYQAYLLHRTSEPIVNGRAGSFARVGAPTASSIVQSLVLPGLATLIAFNFEKIFTQDQPDNSFAGWLRYGVDSLLLKPSDWLIGALTSIPGLQAAPIGALEFILPVLVFLASCAVLIGLWRVLNRLVRAGAERALLRDERSPLLLLRSFTDDPATVPPKSLLFKLISRRVRIEELLGAQFSRLGPFIAVGMPGERLAPLGAYRAYLDDDNWQEAVLRWIDRSSVTVMVVGTTRWVRWELQQIQNFNAADKLIMVFPPDPLGWRKRWAVVGDCFAQSAWSEGLREAAKPEVLVLRLLPHGKVLAVVSQKHGQTDYELALQRAFAN